MPSGSLLVSVLHARPAQQIIDLLSNEDLVRLSSTSQLCRDAIFYAVVPKAQDISQGLESSAIPCTLTLVELSRVIRSRVATGLPL